MVYPPSRDSRTVQWNNIALTKRMMVAKVVMMTMTMGSPQSGDSSAAHTESRAAIQVAPCSHVHPPWCLFYHHHEDGDDYLFHRHCCDIFIVSTGGWDIATLQKAGLDEIFPRDCQSSHLLEVDPHQRLQPYKMLAASLTWWRWWWLFYQEDYHWEETLQVAPAQAALSWSWLSLSKWIVSIWLCSNTLTTTRV